VLNVSKNNLAGIESLAQLVNLKSLLLSHNKIAQISNLESLQYLEILDLSNNQIEEIAGLSQCKLLNSLSLANNKISQFGDLLENQLLEYIDLRGNQIQSLENVDLLLPSSIKTLYLGRNAIEQILEPRYLNFLDNLMNIDFSKNPFVNKLQRNCGFEPKIFILFLIGKHLKKINSSKIVEEDLKSMELLFIDV